MSGDDSIKTPEPVDPAADLRAENQRLREALQSIAMQRDQYQAVFNQAPLMIWFKDDQNRVILANPAAARTANMTPEQMAGQSTWSLFPKGADAFYADDLAVVRSGVPKLDIVEKLDAAEGDLWIRTDKFPWRDPAGHAKGVVVFVRDITHQHRLEEKLQIAQRIEALGVLAGGIAHDFNNMLGGIFGNLELAATALDPSHRAQHFLRQAATVQQRATNLSQQLLTFATGGNPVKRPVLLPHLISDTVGFAMSGASQTCRLDVEDSLCPCVLDPGQIGQALDNLVLNAKEASPPGSVITVEARNVRLAPGNPLALEPGPYVTISVCDPGVGIEPDNLKRVFDPFFTTKPGGSGLGLATTYSIIRRHLGALDVRSTPGQGSTFTLYLPASPAIDPVPEKGTATPRPGSGRVLVVDDEAYMREVVSNMLMRLGYEPSCASGSTEALDLVRRALASNRPFAAAILDLTMPGDCSGEDMAAAIHALAPTLPAVVASGYSQAPVLAEPQRYGFSGVLQKPYTLATLAASLHDAVETCRA